MFCVFREYYLLIFINLLKYIYTGCIHISKDAIFKICALSYIHSIIHCISKIFDILNGIYTD